jgi:hypothetical protein
MMSAKLPTFSIRFMLLIMALFCAILGCLFYLARIPLIVDEWYTLFGSAPPPHGPTNRGSWLMFLMFTYISPLLLAGTIYALAGLWRYYDARFTEPEQDSDRSPLD